MFSLIRQPGAGLARVRSLYFTTLLRVLTSAI